MLLAANHGSLINHNISLSQITLKVSPAIHSSTVQLYTARVARGTVNMQPSDASKANLALMPIRPLRQTRRPRPIPSACSAAQNREFVSKSPPEVEQEVVYQRQDPGSEDESC